MSQSDITVLDLFSGIGGMSLGLEMASPRFRTVLFCERDAFCRRVLAKHWPEVPQHDDICSLDAATLAAVGPVRLIAGGFPCQDVSVAGKGAGLDGERSGLWFEMHRVIDLVRPRWCLVENVPALRSRGADRVISDLEASGYTCWPSVVGAVHAGAPHRRQRVWIVAHAERELGGARGAGDAQQGARGRHAGRSDVGPHLADADDGQRDGADEAVRARRHAAGSSGGPVADADSQRPEHQVDAGRDARAAQRRLSGGRGAHVGLAGLAELPLGQGPTGQRAYAATAGAGWWSSESRMGRVLDGAAPGMDGRAGGEGAVAQQAHDHADQRPPHAVRFWPTPHGMSGAEPGRAYDGHGNELAQAIRVAEGTSDSERSAAKVRSYEQEPWERGIPRTVGKGFPNRVPRLQALGNAVVPQVVAMFGRWIAMVEGAGE